MLPFCTGFSRQALDGIPLSLLLIMKISLLNFHVEQPLQLRARFMPSCIELNIYYVHCTCTCCVVYMYYITSYNGLPQEEMQCAWHSFHCRHCWNLFHDTFPMCGFVSTETTPKRHLLQFVHTLAAFMPVYM